MMPGAHLGAVSPIKAIIWVLPDVILKVRLPTLVVWCEDPELTAVGDGRILDRAGVCPPPRLSDSASATALRPASLESYVSWFVSLFCSLFA
jgi:hypothetical protein